ncbi:MAG: hypothetical protein PUP90_30390 [Nostoc sp. S4]|nr:hypothetical protein [Nostoc sp. S4]
MLTRGAIAYVYNSQSFQIYDDAKFLVEANGEKRIENFAVEYCKDVAMKPGIIDDEVLNLANND